MTWGALLAGGQALGNAVYLYVHWLTSRLHHARFTFQAVLDQSSMSAIVVS